MESHQQRCLSTYSNLWLLDSDDYITWDLAHLWNQHSSDFSYAPVKVPDCIVVSCDVITITKLVHRQTFLIPISLAVNLVQRRPISNLAVHRTHTFSWLHHIWLWHYCADSNLSTDRHINGWQNFQNCFFFFKIFFLAFSWLHW